MDKGPIYGVKLLDLLPLGTGPMKQALPSAEDLQQVRKISERTVAGYEVLLEHYRQARADVKYLCAKIERLREAGRYVVTALGGTSDCGGWTREQIYDLFEHVCEQWPELDPRKAEVAGEE